MHSPLGYDDAAVGETFVKIGVGELRKPHRQEYSFAGDYKIVAPGQWEVTSGDSWVEFNQRLRCNGGWGYDYTKRIALIAGTSAFTIGHSLTNIGTRPINTDHYCHNFFMIDSTPIGSDYSLRLPHATDGSVKRGELVRMRKGGGIDFIKPIEDKPFFWEMQGYRPTVASNWAVIENHRTSAAVEIVGDSPLIKYNIYATSTAVCPEPYVAVAVEPAARQEWTTTYTLKLLGD